MNRRDLLLGLGAAGVGAPAAQALPSVAAADWRVQDFWLEGWVRLADGRWWPLPEVLQAHGAAPFKDLFR